MHGTSSADSPITQVKVTDSQSDHVYTPYGFPADHNITSSIPENDYTIKVWLNLG